MGRVTMTNRAPLIVAIVLLLLPVLYVGSYFALVVPKGFHPSYDPYGTRVHYRRGGSYAAKFFWPLEQIDWTMRPKEWEPG